MFSVLHHIGLGERMLGWISRIYCNTTAQVKANGLLSEPFPIGNGTRQGCPLSPLLFALSLEPFLCKIRLNPNIQGLSVGDSQCKISAYVDGFFFSLTNPTISLPNLLKEFDTYGALLNLKINFSKSEAMGVAIPPHTILTIQSNFHFKCTNSVLKYLGTYIPSDISRTYALNFPPMLAKTRTLLESWHKGLHSWFGRCNLVKMCILSKFLYLFQALPILIPPSFFKQVQALFTRFVWAQKKPHLSQTQMSLPKQNGGLALSDIRQCNIQTLGTNRAIPNQHTPEECAMVLQLHAPRTEIPPIDRDHIKTQYQCHHTNIPHVGKFTDIHDSRTSKLHVRPSTCENLGYDRASKSVTGGGRWLSLSELTDATGKSTFLLERVALLALHP